MFDTESYGRTRLKTREEFIEGNGMKSAPF